SPPFLSPRRPPHPALPSFPTRRSSDLPSPSSFPFTITSVMFSTGTGILLCVGSSITEENPWMIVSFCMSMPKNRSMAHSKNSHKIGRAHVELQSRFDLVCRLLLEKKKQ